MGSILFKPISFLRVLLLVRIFNSSKISRALIEKCYRFILWIGSSFIMFWIIWTIGWAELKMYVYVIITTNHRPCLACLVSINIIKLTFDTTINMIKIYPSAVLILNVTGLNMVNSLSAANMTMHICGGNLVRNTRRNMGTPMAASIERVVRCCCVFRAKKYITFRWTSSSEHGELELTALDIMYNHTGA